jgi:hypothetical protein
MATDFLNLRDVSATTDGGFLIFEGNAKAVNLQ